MAAAAVLPLTIQNLPSADLWWHLADGRRILAEHAIPAVNTWSFTSPGHPWQNDEWLFSVLAYSLYLCGGMALLQVAKSLLLCLTVGIAATAALYRGGRPLAVVVATVIAVTWAEPNAFFDVRPQLFTYFFLTLFWFGARHWLATRRSGWLVAFPLLTVLWSNLHPGVLAGTVLLGLFSVGLALDPARRERARPLALSALACIPAACLNVVGPRFLLFPFHLWHSIWSQHLNEWQPTLAEPHQHAGFLLESGLTLLVMALSWRRFERCELLVWTAFGVLSWSGWRHIPLFALLSIPMWATVLSSVLPRLPGRLWPVLAVLGVAIGGWRLSRADVPRQSMETTLFPRWACDFLVANPRAARLYHPYGWGGYLLWRLPAEDQVFIDGRAIQAYPDQVYLDYLKAAFDLPSAQGIWDHYGVDTIVCFRVPEGEVSSRLMAGRAGWTKVWEDDLAQVWLRGSVDTHSLVYPPSPYRWRVEADSALRSGHAAQAGDDYRQALALDPNDARAALGLGGIAFQTGDPATGERWTREALRLDPSLVEGWLNLALAARMRHDVDAERKALDEAVRIDPGNETARHLREGP